MKKILLIIVLSVFFLVQIPSEEFYLGITPLSESSTDPAPYEDDEFPAWAWKVRRFEVIFFGGIPLMYLFTTLGYDIYQYAAFNNSFGSQRGEKDLLTMFLISVSLSGTIAIIDLIISLVKDNRNKNAELDNLGFSPY